jgi:DNA-binding NarL/FixJ family response regulator
MPNPRVLVVEDDDFTRSLLINALRSQDCDVVLESSSATYALKTATRMHIDAAVLDLNLGRGPTGLDLALGLRRNIPQIGITFLTSYKDPRLLGSTSNLAPYGSVYLEKSSLGDVSRIKRGIEKSIVNAKDAKSRSNIELKNLATSSNLTAVQIEIVRMVAKGYSNSEIAGSRGVTEKSIEQTLSRILKKIDLGIDDKKNRRVELALYYLRQTGVILDETA